MPQLRKFHFEFALEAARALRKDVEDEAVAIEHAPADVLFEIALLAWRERVIDENHVGGRCDRGIAHLVRLAAAHEEAWIGTFAPADHRRDRLRPGGTGQLFELAQILWIDRCAESQPYEHRALTAPGALEHSHPPYGMHYSAADSAATSLSSAAVTLTLRAGTTVEMACLYTI